MKEKSKVVSIVPIEAKVQEYDKLREESKLIKSRMDVLAAEIKDYAEKFGVKNDTGSFYVENDTFIFGKQAKKSVSFVKEKALEFFKKHKFKDCIKTVETIDEDAVEARITAGDISYAELEQITETKVTYAIDVKKKEDLPVVEESQVKVAASKKPKSPLKKPTKG